MGYGLALMEPSLSVVERDIESAINALKQGKLVALPTETVYGLGADASNPQALRKLYQLKGRPEKHPVIVHLASVEQLNDWAIDIPDTAYRLAEAFWPGPLTMILKRATSVPDEVTGGQDTVGVRVPNHPVALALLNAFQGGIAAPSANRFGRLSPTTARHVREEFGDNIAMILDGGPCQVGVESTIIDLSGGEPVILRPGMITPERIEQVLGFKVAISQPHQVKTRAPGTLESHYAPHTPLLLVPAEQLVQTAQSFISQGRIVAIFSREKKPELLSSQAYWVTAPSLAEAYAQVLYARLHELDHLGADILLVEAVPEDEAWLAVRDRLQRAATPSVTSSFGETHGTI